MPCERKTCNIVTKQTNTKNNWKISMDINYKICSGSNTINKQIWTYTVDKHKASPVFHQQAGSMACQVEVPANTSVKPGINTHKLPSTTNQREFQEQQLCETCKKRSKQLSLATSHAHALWHQPWNHHSSSSTCGCTCWLAWWCPLWQQTPYAARSMTSACMWQLPGKTWHSKCTGKHTHNTNETLSETCPFTASHSFSVLTGPATGKFK